MGNFCRGGTKPWGMRGRSRRPCIPAQSTSYPLRSSSARRHLHLPPLCKPRLVDCGRGGEEQKEGEEEQSWIRAKVTNEATHRRPRAARSAHEYASRRPHKREKHLFASSRRVPPSAADHLCLKHSAGLARGYLGHSQGFPTRSRGPAGSWTSFPVRIRVCPRMQDTAENLLDGNASA